MTLPSGIPIDELDPGIRPQDDLFRHVNGRWLARTEIPADRARDSVFRILAEEAENAVREIVEEAASAPEGSEERKFGDLYASFMDADRAELLGSQPISQTLAAGGGSPALLPRLLPPGKAMQMLMTGEPISAQEAHRLGMVNELYAQDELIDAAHRIAEKIGSNSPTAVQAVKQAVRMGQGEPIEQAIAIMMEAHWRSAVHPDRVEGIGAFNEGREPHFQDPDH
jgi:Peptidase family M13/Enoyl-CoA hydratase/isomerase